MYNNDAYDLFLNIINIAEWLFIFLAGVAYPIYRVFKDGIKKYWFGNAIILFGVSIIIFIYLSALHLSHTCPYNMTTKCISESGQIAARIRGAWIGVAGFIIIGPLISRREI